MSVHYDNLSVRLDTQAAKLWLRCRAHNRGKQTWRVEQAASLGWQVYDPRTQVFISEGEWVAFPADVTPGSFVEMELGIPIPSEPGPYRIYVSPVLGADGWTYMRGSRLVVVDVIVDGAGTRITNARVTTLRRLWLHSLPAWLSTIFSQPFAALTQNWRLMESMVRRDLHARYRGSIGDRFWAVLNPLLLMLTYGFVFGVVLQTRFRNDTTPAGFVLYFLAGMMPWLPLSEALARAPHAIIEHRNFVKKLLFPLEIIPVTQTAAALVTQSIALVLFMAAIIVFRERLPWSVCWLPLLLVPQAALTLGLSWLLAGLGVFLRDLGQLMGFLLTLWFFITPICYPEQQLPTWALPVLGKNPVYILVHGYRAIFLENRSPEFGSLWKLYLLAFVAFFFGYAAFRRLRKSFADVL